MINAKIVLTGDFGVGKTSLFKRYVFDEFSNDYQASIGVRVEKKEIKLDNNIINLLLWDIAGRKAQDLVPESYFKGAASIILVVDLSVPDSFHQIKTQLNHIKKIEPNAIIKIVGNKKDLLPQKSLDDLLLHLPVPFSKITSAKTGENVHSLFTEIAQEIYATTVT